MKKRVLVVDDHPDIRKMMRILLEMYGYDVVEAADGYEAVERAINDKPDLIFMDIGMPLLDGVQAIAAIRAHAEFADTEKIPFDLELSKAPAVRDQALTTGLDIPLEISILLLKVLRLQEQSFRPDDSVIHRHSRS